jgi:hypothetical protein
MKAAVSLPFIVVGVDVAVNNEKVFCVATKIQQWVSFALLSNYKTLRIFLDDEDDNNTNNNN